MASSVYNALENLARLLQNQAGFWSLLIRRIAKMRGAENLYKRVSEGLNKEEIQDHLAVVLYALVFAANDFEVEIEPLGGIGPDLGVSKADQRAFVEVTRFRRMYPGPTLLGEDEQSTILQYGDLARDVQKCWSKIVNKFDQVDRGDAIIAIWNDDEDLEEIELDIAAEIFRKKGSQGIVEIPHGLAFVIYGSKWIGPGTKRMDEQFYCFPLASPLKQSHTQWISEIETTLREDVIRKRQVPSLPI